MIDKIKVVNKGCCVAIIAILIPICVIGAWALTGFIGSFFPMSPVEFAGVLLKVDIPEGTTVISDVYSESSFPTGDGHTWTVLQIPHEKVNEFAASLKASPFWKPLPLSPELADQQAYLQPTIMFGLDGTIPIKNATGYYFFVDRQEASNKKDNSQTYDTFIPFSKRNSLNYTFGLFNDRDGKLYVWSIDT